MDWVVPVAMEALTTRQGKGPRVALLRTLAALTCSLFEMAHEAPCQVLHSMLEVVKTCAVCACVAGAADLLLRPTTIFALSLSLRPKREQ